MEKPKCVNCVHYKQEVDEINRTWYYCRIALQRLGDEDLVTGEAGQLSRDNKSSAECYSQRLFGTVISWIGSNCGKKGRWYVARETTEGE